MISLLLAADALAKLGATVGGGLAVIGAGIGIGRIGGQAGGLQSSMILAAALVEGATFLALVISILALFV